MQQQLVCWLSEGPLLSKLSAPRTKAQSLVSMWLPPILLAKGMVALASWGEKWGCTSSQRASSACCSSRSFSARAWQALSGTRL